MAEARFAPRAPSTVDELLEASWPGRGRLIRGRELRLELMVTAAFLLLAGTLVAVAAPVRAPHVVAAALVVAYALAARVEFPIGAAMLVPTQLFLVPLFVVAPAALVPLLVFAACVLAAVAAAATGRGKLDRVVFCGGDASHALGPAAVLTVFADGDAAQAGAVVLVAAALAQLLADFMSSSLHELLSMGASARLHLRMLARVWAVDAALGAFGLLAAWAAVSMPWAALAPLPLVLLLQAMAADRTRSVGAAHDRLVALEQERGRRQAAAALLERQDSFLQDVSHELRTPSPSPAATWRACDAAGGTHRSPRSRSTSCVASSASSSACSCWRARSIAAPPRASASTPRPSSRTASFAGRTPYRGHGGSATSPRAPSRSTATPSARPSTP